MLLLYSNGSIAVHNLLRIILIATLPTGDIDDNYPMSAPPQLVSIGYEGRDIEQLVAALKTSDVQVLVDVRLTPISRKRGLSKSALREALSAVGIRYVHHRELGNPKDNREAFRQGSSHSRERFRHLLESDQALDAIHHVTELLDEGTVALLCFERDHAQCHRGIVAEVIAEEKHVELTCV